VFNVIPFSDVSLAQSKNFNYIPWEDKPTYNCTIARVGYTLKYTKSSNKLLWSGKVSVHNLTKKFDQMFITDSCF
jgi:hypothetical protein